MTASAALEQHVDHAGDAGRDQPGLHHVPGRKPIYDTHHVRPDPVHRRDREVEQRRRDQGRAEGRAAARSATTSRASGSARRSARTSAARPPASSGIRRSSNDSALASVSMGYQVGVTPLQMVTRGQLGRQRRHRLLEPRVVRAFIKDGRRVEVPHKEVRQAITADTAATLTTIMEQVVERGTAQAAQIPGYTIAGKTGTAAKLVNGHYQKSDYNASFVGFIPSRKPALDDPRRHRFAARRRATPAAPSPRRSSSASRKSTLTLSRRSARTSTRRRRCSSRGTIRRTTATPRRSPCARPACLSATARAGAQRPDAGPARPQRARGAQARCRGSA